MADKALSLPMWKKWMYALGQFGWSLAAFCVGSQLVYFYLPPSSMPMGPFVFQGYVLPIITINSAVVFGLTIIGLVFALGRLFDGITDPLVAGLSDRCKFKFGKRRSFLAISVLPFAILSALVFFPIEQGITALNTVWLFTSVFLFYWFMTMYVTPFFALLPELGHTPDERLQLSTFISITWALGTMVGSQATGFQAMLMGSGYSATQAFQLVVSGFAVVSFFFMLLPIIFIDEKKYCEPSVSTGSIFKSFIEAFKNRNFLRFTLSDLAYWVSITIINSVLVYYVSILLKLPVAFTAGVTMVMFLLSFLFYVPVNILSKKIGKKTVLTVAFVWFAALFVYVSFLGTYPIQAELQAYLVAIFAAVPLACFGIVQNAIVADIAEADAIETGNAKAAIFFGARTFMSKLGQTIAGLVIPSMLILGLDASQIGSGVVKNLSEGGATSSEAGVRFTAIVAAVFCVIGLLLFLRYNEKQILKTLATRENLSKEELAAIQEGK